MRKTWQRAGQPFRNMFDAAGIARMGKKAPHEFAAMCKVQVAAAQPSLARDLLLIHRREFVRGLLTHANDARRVEHIPERLARPLPHLPHRQRLEESRLPHRERADHPHDHAGRRRRTEESKEERLPRDEDGRLLLLQLKPGPGQGLNCCVVPGSFVIVAKLRDTIKQTALRFWLKNPPIYPPPLLKIKRPLGRNRAPVLEVPPEVLPSLERDLRREVPFGVPELCAAVRVGARGEFFE